MSFGGATQYSHALRYSGIPANAPRPHISYQGSQPMTCVSRYVGFEKIERMIGLEVLSLRILLVLVVLAGVVVLGDIGCIG